MASVIQALLQSEEPSIRYRVVVDILGHHREDAQRQMLRQEIRRSPRVRTPLSERDPTGHIPHHPYSKWVGAHWVLASLADLSYPAGDESLMPLRELVKGGGG